MLSARPWDPESVLRMLMLLFFGLGVVGMVGYGVERAVGGGEGSEGLRMSWVSVAGTLTFQAFCLGLVAWLVRANRMTWRDAFGFGRRRLSTMLLLGAGVAALVFPLNLSLMWASQRVMEWVSITPVAQPTVEALQAAETPGHRWLLGLMAMLMAPVVEELLFRGILYPSLKQSGYPRIALYGTALLFAATHANVMTFVPLTFFAVVLAQLYEYTDNLLAPIFAHGCFNAINFFWLLWILPGG